MVSGGVEGTELTGPTDHEGVPVIRIQKGEIRPKMGGIYFFVWPVFLSVLIIFISTYWYPEGFDESLVLVLVINTALALIYTRQNIKPAMGLELSLEHAKLYYLFKGEGAELAVEVSLDNRAVVDVVLNDTTTSEKYGNLCGWTFKSGNDEFTVSASDGWELWDIQSLREPLFELIERHGMERGEALQDYQQGLAKVLETPSRTV